MFRDPEIRAAFRSAMIICGLVLLNKVTKNWSFLGLAFYGVVVAAKQKLGKSICVYLLIAFLPAINLMLAPRYGHYAMIARLSSLVITTALVLGAGTRPGHHQIPIGTIFLYLAVAFFSSIFGYFPLISHLKILNFSFFILGIYIGTRNINLRIHDIDEIRHMILAIVLLLTYGSLLTLPFPSIAYFTSLQHAVRGQGIASANEFFASGQRLLLFTGIGTTSQFTGPACACMFGWLLCDMWLVKKKLSVFHLALMAPIPFICYLSRSRLAFFILILAMLLTTLSCLPHARVSRRVKSSFIGLAILGAIMLIALSAIAEIHSGTITKWLRKQYDTTDTSDDRSLGTAITSSRQGLIELNLRDFRRNILLGSGFQVDSETKAKFKSGRASLFSATIEKGILPLMILGETGILGACAFSIFLIVFYHTCKQKRYMATSTLFTVYLATNMAEATFFAPSGGGGSLWILLVVGGFVIDMQQYVPQPLPTILGGDSFTEEEDEEDLFDDKATQITDSHYSVFDEFVEGTQEERLSSC